MASRAVIALGIIAIIVVSGLFITYVYNPFVIPDGGDGGTPTLPPGVEQSKFSFPLFAEDTRTATASMTVTAWYDWNSDGKMQYTELRSFTDSSGTYTSNGEYPIGLDYDIWIQAYGSAYQATYTKVHMSGSKNSDGSAKTLVEDVFIRATDDSLTYAGLMNNIAWDDSSDYNASLSGETGTADVIFELSAADKGLSSNMWEAENYMSIYGGLLDTSKFGLGFWLKWDQITGPTVEDSAVMAPDFFGIYMTVQDKIDLGITVGDFDFSGDDNTNWYGLAVVSSTMGDLMYNSADSPAPRPRFSFGFSGCSASGTTIATYGVAIHTGLTYTQMSTFKWTASAAYYLGTPGDDWDWTHL